MYSLRSHLKCTLVFYFYVTSYPQTRWFKATTVSYLTSFESGIWAGLSWMIPFFYMASVRVSWWRCTWQVGQEGPTQPYSYAWHLVGMPGYSCPPCSARASPHGLSISCLGFDLGYLRQTVPKRQDEVHDIFIIYLWKLECHPAIPYSLG